MSGRDRETWERFAAAVVCGIYADPTAGALRDEWLVKEADRFLAITKERWPEPEPAKRCEAEASSREDVKGEPDPGEGYRWVQPGEIRNVGDEFRSDAGSWEVVWHFQHQGETVHERYRYRYRRRIDAAPETTPPAVAIIGPGSTQAERWLPGEIGAESPEPAMYSIVWDGDDTPDTDWCCRTEAECKEYLGRFVSRKGTVVPLYAVPVDAAREIAAARREAEEARAECERLRMTEEEHDALDEARRLGDQWVWSETIRALQKRHTRETVGG
jgi:hypothetical protein